MKKETVDLIERIRAGDKDSFDILYREYSQKLYKYIMRIVKNHHDAEDILEETFMKVIENIGELRYALAFDIWIYRTAKNTALHFLEKKDNSAAAKPDCELDDLTDVPDVCIPLPEDYAVRKDIADRVNAAVCTLSDEQRETVYLKYYENKTIAEISKIMNVSQGTVKTRLNLAKKHLAKKLEQFKDNGSVFTYVPIGSLLRSVKKPVKVTARPVFALRLAGTAVCAGVALTGLSAYLGLDVSNDNNNFGYYRYETSNPENNGYEAGIYHELDMKVKAMPVDDIGVFVIPEPDKTLFSTQEEYDVVIEGTVMQAKGYIVDEYGEVWYDIQYNNLSGWIQEKHLGKALPDEVFPIVPHDDLETEYE